MKTIILAVVIIGISACAYAALTDEQKIKALVYGKACMDEARVDPQHLMNHTQGNMDGDKKLKKIGECIIKKGGFQNEAGEFQPEKLVKLLQNLPKPKFAAHN